MPRRIRAPKLENRTQRLKLIERRKPYWIAIAPGISLGYRRGPGSWNVRAADGKGGNWIKSFGLADDHAEADNAHVFDYWTAQDRARQLARGEDGTDSGRPETVDEAISAYADDLVARGGNPANATGLRAHIPTALLAKPVSLVTAREWRRVRDAMAQTMRGASVNRYCNSLKACLNLAARLDKRIGSAAVWKDGLSIVSTSDSSESNIVLTDRERRAVIAAAYESSEPFGLYVETHAVTGARTSQIAALNVADFETGASPRLMVLASRKGKPGKQRKRVPLPIPAGLSQRLAQHVAGRGPDEPLLLSDKGARWQPPRDDHGDRFEAIARRLRLDQGRSKLPTVYALRHTSITRMLLAAVPVRMVAAAHDTSVAMIEKTYSKFVVDHGDQMLRAVVFDVDAAPPTGKVVALAPTSLRRPRRV